MSPFRLAPVALLLLTACAAWEASTPNRVPPPAAENPVSSRYAPPPPGETPAPMVPILTRVAIASVQLLGDCPDAPVAAPAAAGAPSESSWAGDSMAGARRRCEQSTVQLAIRSTNGGQFRVEGVRVLDAARRRVAGSSTLRQPTQWSAADSSYLGWNERVVDGNELQIAYKLGDLDLSRAAQLAGPDFDPYFGPFILELDVSIDGRRQTIRSPEFRRENMDMIQT
jgi:hypothetical protein